MKVTLLVVGRLKERYWQDAEAEYTKRLRPYCTLRVVECKDEDALLAAVPEGARLVALDERGGSVSSVEFAHGVLGDAPARGGLALAIGGADGHGDRVRQRAERLLSFGRLTIAHRLVRLLVLEQVYRGFRILRGEPYHRE